MPQGEWLIFLNLWVCSQDVDLLEAVDQTSDGQLVDNWFRAGGQAVRSIVNEVQCDELIS